MTIKDVMSFINEPERSSYPYSIADNDFFRLIKRCSSHLLLNSIIFLFNAATCIYASLNLSLASYILGLKVS